MEVDELILVFISFLTALAVSDLLISTHNLVRIRKFVKWNWIPMTWALIAFVIILTAWFGAQYLWNVLSIETIGGFLLFLTPILFLLLTSMAALPDNPTKEGIDLLDWYLENRGYFFPMLSLCYLSLFGLRIFSIVQRDIPFNFLIILMFISTITIPVLLLFSKKLWVHRLFTIIYAALTIVQFWTPLIL